MIEGFDPSDPCHVLAKIPAAALKGIEIWVAKTFAESGKVELRSIGSVDT
jgi:hypothetical protein